MEGLTATLSSDVVLWTDGGGDVRGAATWPVRGRIAVATFLEASRRFLFARTARIDLASVNLEPGLILRDGERPVTIVTFEVEDDHISTLRFVANPDKLRHLAR